MSESTDDFLSNLRSLDHLDNRDEGMILLLERMLKKDPQRIRLVTEEFNRSNDEDVKGILAALIVKYSKEKKYRDYLIDNHGWETADFE